MEKIKNGSKVITGKFPSGFEKSGRKGVDGMITLRIHATESVLAEISRARD
jgi:hypothetical protein